MTPMISSVVPKLVSSFASKADYTVKVPAKEPFRAAMPAAATGKKGSAKK